jgi:hypothetical protein
MCGRHENAHDGSNGPQHDACLLLAPPRTEGITAMNNNNIGLNLTEEDVLDGQLSDEALERAGGLENRAGMTIAMCSGLSSCPSAPA